MNEEEIEQYYQLKNEYETEYRGKMKKKKELKMTCKLCNKDGLMTFSRKKHILLAQCDNKDCPKLEIILPITHTFPDYLERVNKKINENMISLTRDKLDVFYSISNTSNTEKIIERLQTEQAWKATLERTYDETTNRYNVQREEDEMKLKLSRFVKDIQMFIQDGNIKEATEIYKNNLLPLREQHLAMFNKELEWDETFAMFSKQRKDTFISRMEFTE
jgi:hypothetical protein